MSLLALFEYYRIVFNDKEHAVFSPITVWGALCGLLIIGSASYIQSFQVITGLLVLNFIGAAILSMPQYKNGPGILNVVEKQIQAVIYIPLSLSLMVLLRNDPQGVAWIFFLLFIVFAGDVGRFIRVNFSVATS